MSSYRQCLLVLSLILQICTIYGDGIQKSSLVFVIDDTGSMWNEIHQVKEEANKIFETVLRANASQIENFVLVTFNDPDARLRTVTKNRDEFKRALASINVGGGDDCPEYAIKGIELALKNSLPLSYLYVFTDASAKDYDQFEYIKGLSQKQQSQVVFVLTGKCRSENDADFKVYHKIAEATSGQVFPVMKDDIKDILKYVEETITGRGHVLVTKKLSPGYGKGVKYMVDGHSGDVLISVTGKKPKIGEVTGPGGSKPKTERLFPDKDESAIVKVTGAVPGEHEVEVGSKSETYAVITAKTSIDIQLGFSTFKPTSIDDTATRPAPDGNSFLSVKIIGDGVKFEVAKILDMSDNVIAEMPLVLEDETGKFYVTSPFDPPTTLFRVSVSGYDTKTKTPITRRSPTPIERQKPTTEQPKITTSPSKVYEAIEGDAHLSIPCTVTGFPQPVITWKMNALVISPDTKYSISNGTLFIRQPKVSDTNSYTCEAKNEVGTVSVTFQTHILQKPKLSGETAKKVRVGTTASIECIVMKGDPNPKIAWQFMEKSASKFAPIAGSNNVLRIPTAEKKHAGHYKCVAQNSAGSDEHITTLVVEYPPEININKTVYEGVEGDVALRIPCDVDGIPKPEITWKFKGATIIPNANYSIEDGALVIMNPETDLTSYICEAKNYIGSVNATFQAKVEKTLDNFGKVNRVYLLEEETRKLECEVYSSKSQSVQWFKEGENMNIDKPYIEFKVVSLSDDGNYTCRVSDKHGHIHTHTYEVDVGTSPILNSPTIDNDWRGDIDDILTNCNAHRPKPKAKITWTFNGQVLTDRNITELGISYTWGHYTCNVSNVHGFQLRSFDVKSSSCLISRNLRDAEYMPLLLTDDKSWPTWETTTHYSVVDQGNQITLSCPNHKDASNEFRKFPKQNEVKATCIQQDKFSIDGNVYKLSDLQCTAGIRPSVIRKKVNCSTETSELIRVGYNVDGFLETYEVCFDHAKNMPQYTRTLITDKGGRDTDVVPYNWYRYPGIGDGTHTTISTCNTTLSSCCFSKSQLVNGRDFNDGPAQNSTFIDPLNVIPSWQPCNTSKTKWEDIDGMVRERLTDYPKFVVWSGVHTLQEKHGAFIPRYLWKVLRFNEEEAIAIVHVNDQSPTDKDIKCENICTEAEDPWFKASDMYTYCCNMSDFLKAFDMSGTDVEDSLDDALKKIESSI